MKITDAEVQEVIRQLKVKGKHLDALAETVFNQKSQEACEINNGGIEAQVRYILELDGIEEGKKAISEAIA